MTIRKSETASEEPQARLAELDAAIAALSEERLAAHRVVSFHRAAALHSRSPAYGPPAVRGVLEAAAVAAHAEAQAAEAALAARQAALVGERDGLRSTLAHREQEQAASRTGGDLRRELAAVEQLLTRATQALVAASRAVPPAALQERYAETDAGRQFRQGGEAAALQTWRTATAATAAARAAVSAASQQVALVTAKRDALVGELDRRSRGWQPPQPSVIPPLPAATGDVDADCEGMQACVANLQRRRARLAERLRSATTDRDGVTFDARTPRGVSVARYQDAEAATRQYTRDLQALRQRQQEAQAALLRLEHSTAIAV